MRKLLATLVSVSLVFVVSGCGGTGVNSLIPNPLAGTYSGTGTATGTLHNFQALISIGSNGALSGTITDETTLSVATIGGTVSVIDSVSNGTISVVSSSNQSQGSGTLAGTFSEVSSNQGVATEISASLSATISGSTEIFTFSDLVQALQQVSHR